MPSISPGICSPKYLSTVGAMSIIEMPEMPDAPAVPCRTIGQAVVVLIVASALAAIQARRPTVARKIVLAGSVVVIAAGSYWFAQRVW